MARWCEEKLTRKRCGTTNLYFESLLGYQRQNSFEYQRGLPIWNDCQLSFGLQRSQQPGSNLLQKITKLLPELARHQFRNTNLDTRLCQCRKKPRGLFGKSTN